VIENVQILGNDLRSSVVAVDTDAGRKIVYPPDAKGDAAVFS
jgi:hypothetical protein